MAIYVTSSVTPFALGTAVNTRVSSSFNVPSNAVELVATRNYVVSTAPNPAETLAVKVDIGGQDWNNSPAEHVPMLGYSKLGAIGNNAQLIEDKFTHWNLPVKANSSLEIGGTLLDALAGNGKLATDFVWSTVPTGQIPYLRKVSATTSTATTNGASVTLSGVSRLTGLDAIILPSTIAGDNASNGFIEVTSSSLAEQQQTSVGYQVGAIEATSGIAPSPIQHSIVDIPVQAGKSTSVTFTSVNNVTDALGTAGLWAYELTYIPTSIQA